MIQLPTLDEAETRILQGGDTPLDRMISEHQPIDTFRAHSFRTCLTQVLQQFDKGVPRRFKPRSTRMSCLRVIVECVLMFFAAIGFFHLVDDIFKWITQ